MSKRYWAAIWLAGLLLGWLPAPNGYAQEVTTAKTFYVAPNGSDSNSGGPGDPFRTLEAARDAIRSLKGVSGLPAGGVNVYLREGTYPRSESFELTEEDSGTADSPVVYRAYPGETVRLSGGTDLDRAGFQAVTDPAVLQRIVDPDARGKIVRFDLAANGLTDYGQLSRHGYWKASDISQLPPMQLYVDGQGMTLARWPNNGTVQMGDIVDPGPTVDDPDLQTRGGTFKYEYDRPRYWTQADDIWLDGIFGYSWEWSYNKIASIDTGNRTIKLQYGEMSGIQKNWYPDFHFAENLLEEIDAPGEYYIDRTTGVLYLLPNAAFLTGHGDITVTTLKKPMITTIGASHIRFEELVMEYGRDTAAVIIGGSSVTISHCDIANFTGGAVFVNVASRFMAPVADSELDGVDHSIDSTDIHHIGALAVTLNGGDAAALTPGNNRVTNSHIHDFAYYNRAYNPGVVLRGVGNKAVGNEIHDAPHPGILIFGNDHLVEYNNVYDICKMFSDLGAIYMNAGATPQERGTVVRRNYFHHIGEHKPGVEGVYPDNLTMGLTIEQNIFYKMGNAAIKSNAGSYIAADNNLFIDTYVPYDNQEMFMGNQPGNKIDTDYMPQWQAVFDRYNDFVGTPYLTKYPELASFFEENRYYPDSNGFTNNVIYNPTVQRSAEVNSEGARDVRNLLNYAGNWVTAQDPGFENLAAGDLRLREDAPVFSQIPGFAKIPFELIGTQGKVGISHTPDTVDLVDVEFPYAGITMELGETAAVKAEAIPWNATNPTVIYSSSNPAVAAVDADGNVQALAPGTAVITAQSDADPDLTDECEVTVVGGDGVMHFTDFESGGNGWPVDANTSIEADSEGNHWYRLVGGANAQSPRDFTDYVLEYKLKTPASMPVGANFLMYERNETNGSGYVFYKKTAAGSLWALYDSKWQTLAEVDLTQDDLQPDRVYAIKLVVQGANVTLYVDGDLRLQGANPSHSPSGKVGFYVEGFTDMQVDDVKFSLVREPVTGVELDQSAMSLEMGERRQLKANVLPQEASNRKVRWVSSDSAVVSVDDAGMVTAHQPGSALIAAVSDENDGVKAESAVTVLPWPDYAIQSLDMAIKDKKRWTDSDALDFHKGNIRIAGDSVYGYEGQKFGSVLLRFNAKLGAFDGGWYGFALRSDRTGDPTWVNGNKGYLVVIKEDQIEFQTWKPGQKMVRIIPNDAFEAGREYKIEIGVIRSSAGDRFILKSGSRVILNESDADPNNPIAAEGYFNVYNYAGANEIELMPAKAK
ncbi:Ig-like domain-containing protein [Paenibacillus spongiae]|uniref:Ig-like domain-containing protein n=1 Tax=Paenibacillus spongiae TaxID=2909671 RepID=A0ABY5S653_9BACL|nr:Ig-like domain-containing protein [Paenibacillus spongiae]UVI29386.1 Ig-like domain-containing protein [Paenibacillus spongiae]